MILSDRELAAALHRGAVKLTPTPSGEAWSSTAVDLHLASKLTSWIVPKVGGVRAAVCPADVDYDFPELLDKYSEKHPRRRRLRHEIRDVPARLDD